MDCVLDAAGAVIDYLPNPDYYTHALWQRVMSSRSLAVTVGDGARVTVFAACAARAGGGAAGGVALVLVNFATEAVSLNVTVSGGGIGGATRLQWLLTPGDAAAGLASASMRLNGRTLALGALDALPEMLPEVVPATAPLTLPRLSYGFIALPDARAPACSGGA